MIDDSRTVREVVEEAVKETVDLLKEFEEINAKFGEEMSDDEMNALLERQGDGAGETRSSRRLGSGFAAGDGHGCAALSAAGNAGQGSFRWRASAGRRCAGLLLQKPDILLLDEPTNHLDAESVAWLEHHLQSYAGNHHRGNARSGIFSTTWRAGFWSWIAVKGFLGKEITLRAGWSRSRSVCGVEEKSESERQKTLQRELEWIRMSPKARQAKGKARINAYESLLQQAVREATGGPGDSHSAGPTSGRRRN